MLESFTYNGLAHNLIEMCVEPENTLPTNWEDYLSVVTFKDGADFDDPTAVTDAGKYALAFSIKDTKNVTWVDSSGARDALTYTVYCVIEPKVLIIECWSDKPGEPVFSETVASKYYKLVYTDASGKEITKNEATKAYGQTCRVTITVPDGMEGNVELRAVSGIGLYEDFICYDITTDIPTLLTKPQLVKTQIEYTGNDISILDYMNTDYNANYMYISGNISVISVGEDYTVYVMISGLVNATWADKTTGALCLKFSVIKANVEEEWDTSQRVPFLVGGESLVDYVYYDLSGKKIASEDLVEGVQYYVSAVVKDEYKESFSFANGTAESTKYQFKVTPPVAVIIPTMANYSLVYNAQSQTFALSGVDASYVEYNADELTQTEAGVYYVTVSLKSGSYAVWDDETGGTDTRRIQFVITKKAVEVDWDMSTALPSLNLHGVIPNTAVTYKYYDSNGNQVGANALKEGEAYTIKAVISDEYAKNYMFGDSSDTTSEAKSFTYIKGDTDTALSDDDNSIKKLGGLSIPSDFPLWQIIVGSISFVVGFIAYVQAGINNRAARRMNRRTNHMKCSTVGVGLALLALFGIENVGWTVIAIVLLALCILGIGAWIVSKIKRAVAEDRMDHYNNGSYNGGNGYNGGGGSSGYNGGNNDGAYNGGGGITDDDGFYDNYNNDPKG
jgi:multisubunit Na+/H+ antiporter MnhG subunit